MNIRIILNEYIHIRKYSDSNKISNIYSDIHLMALRYLTYIRIFIRLKSKYSANKYHMNQIKKDEIDRFCGSDYILVISSSGSYDSVTPG